MSSVDLALLAIGVGMVLITFWFFGMCLFAGSRRWFNFRKRIGCVFGKHSPGTLQPAVGGRQVQRCLYCDRIISEFTVSIDSVRRSK